VTALTIKEKLIYGRIKKAAVIWLLLLRLDPSPLTEKDAAEILQINKSTARDYLRTLSELHIITRLGRYSGYILTDTGRQMALPEPLTKLAKAKNSPSEAIINDCKNDSIKDHQVLLIDEGENFTFEGEKSAFGENPEIGDALLKLGIVENHKTRTLIERGLTTRDIHNAAAKIRNDPMHDLNETGLLITIMDGLLEKRNQMGGYENWNE